MQSTSIVSFPFTFGVLRNYFLPEVRKIISCIFFKFFKIPNVFLRPELLNLYIKCFLEAWANFFSCGSPFSTEGFDFWQVPKERLHSWSGRWGHSSQRPGGFCVQRPQAPRGRLHTTHTAPRSLLGSVEPIPGLLCHQLLSRVPLPPCRLKGQHLCTDWCPPALTKLHPGPELLRTRPLFLFLKEPHESFLSHLAFKFALPPLDLSPFMESSWYHIVFEGQLSKDFLLGQMLLGSSPPQTTAACNRWNYRLPKRIKTLRDHKRYKM